MGHIQLAVPVSHIWFLRGVPSKIGMALGMSPQELEKIIYFSSYMILNVEEEERTKALNQLDQEYKNKIKEINKLEEAERNQKTEELKVSYKNAKDELKSLVKLKIISELEYFNLSSRYGQVFSAGIGAEAIRRVLESIKIEDEIKKLKADLNNEEIADKKKILKRIKLFQGFLKAGLHLEWMLPTIIPVIPPDLRPMVALDGGRFATSDLNDLYRRIINRNNRLKKLLEIGAPEVITRNEKRMLQEAVDALFDNNARRGQVSVAASTGQKRALRSLADTLKGKQGRFRQNLLGKRVDYSGRSVIVVGPKLKIYQCGIPKKMALELFKPFIINKLIEREVAYNVRSAGKMVEAESEESYEILDEIISHHYVMLNRAPTLHRLSIQAFRPVLIEGKAIQVHPMVCSAFNADFDGDQMAAHVPLTDKARWESENLMLSSRNLLKPASGDPITTPTLDMVLGCYYITHALAGAKGEGKVFGSFNEAVMAYELGVIGIQAKIKVLFDGKIIETTVGRIRLNEILPEALRFLNEEMTKKELKSLVAKVMEIAEHEEAVKFIDDIKSLGFEFVTKSGISWGMEDLTVPVEKKSLMDAAESKVETVKQQYNMGLLTEEERKTRVIEIWNDTKNTITDLVRGSMDKEGPVYSMVYSKARGSESVVVQMSGMKGLMAGPTGETIELPIKSCYKEGLNVLEYFISTHGARKGMADTALRTATAGYLTRRLVDVSQDVIVQEEDCKDKTGIYLYKEDSDRIGQSFATRIIGRVTLEDVADPHSGEIIVEKGALISKEQGLKMEKLNIPKVKIKSVVTCKTPRGVCQKCYGVDLGRGKLVQIGQAVGIVAAQAIGEPGTQLTMRTFHIGGIAGSDITQGLPRVEELFEARPPKGEAAIAGLDGKVVEITNGEKIITIKVESQDKTKKVEEYQVSAGSTLKVAEGDLVGKGSKLIEGNIELKSLYKTMGWEAVHRYIVREIQEIYASQGEGINDKHIEVIIRQMLSRVLISDSGDSTLVSGEIVEKDEFEEVNNTMKAEGKELSKGERLLMGITKVALSTESFLSAASFQETARVLINAAVVGKEDKLRGLKENVIIGKLIPAGTGYRRKN
jgi:DNA-directed RNA polymerase subunit beta'